ncbi:YkgJ family cysteine cluster protein [Candidatus Woesearchaeota archaeon]|nr:YkgJ family cysteine cluster protein [Candidatus Woesearchaeota archaeon]
MQKFECLKCGNCCRNFKKENNSNINPPYFTGNKLLVLSTPILVFQDWEISLFSKENTIPCHAFFDLKNNQTIIMDYTLNTDHCPNLLQDNKCDIYEKRPLICKGFPCPYADPIDLKTNNTLKSSFGHCKAELPIDELHQELGFEKINNQYQINSNTLRKNLFARYKDSYIYRFMNLIFGKTCKDFLDKLEKNNEIKLTKTGYDLNHLKKRIQNSTKIDISELYKQKTNLDLKDILSNESFNKIKQRILSL